MPTLIEGDTFELSQECFAEMLGVPKSRSPGVVRRLQHAGLISAANHAITVLDRPELEAVACECYRIVRNRYEDCWRAPSTERRAIRIRWARIGHRPSRSRAACVG